MQFKLAAFADESSPILSGQIDALKRNGFDYLEIRNVNGKNVSDLTLRDAKELAAQGGQLLSLEPLLSVFVGLKSLEREGEASIVGTLSFESNEAAFDHAAKALRCLIDA